MSNTESGDASIICAVSFVLFGAWLLFMDLSDLPAARQAHSWPTSKGVIVRSQMVHLSRGGIGVKKDHADIAFRYELDGNSYGVDGIAIKPTDEQQSEAACGRYPVGREVTVHYDNKNPAVACIEFGQTSPTAWSFV